MADLYEECFGHISKCFFPPPCLPTAGGDCPLFFNLIFLVEKLTKVGHSLIRGFLVYTQSPVIHQLPFQCSHQVPSPEASAPDKLWFPILPMSPVWGWRRVVMPFDFNFLIDLIRVVDFQLFIFCLESQERWLLRSFHFLVEIWNLI